VRFLCGCCCCDLSACCRVRACVACAANSLVAGLIVWFLVFAVRSSLAADLAQMAGEIAKMGTALRQIEGELKKLK
jgi:hypothetical protein